MALTEYRYRGFGLNDGVSYFMAYADNASLEDRPEANVSFTSRSEQEPVITGFSLNEATMNLNISIVATSNQDFANKLDALVRLFDTTDPTHHKLERRRPWEQNFLYLMVAPKALTVNRPERKVSITLYSTSRVWLSVQEQTYTTTLFDGTGNTFETVNIQYDGFTPVEPIIELTPKNVGTVGYRPLFLRQVEVWSTGREKIVGSPVLLTSGWDSTPDLAGPGKTGMRSDGADIRVTLARTGEEIPRIVAGTTTNRRVWMRPNNWPDQGRIRLIGRGDWGIGNITAQPYPLALKSTDTQAYIRAYTGDLRNFLANGRLRAGNEVMRYSVKQFFDNNTAALLQLTRGQDGTPAADHRDYTFVATPETVNITYGYSDEFPTRFDYVTNHWPSINYDTSTNTAWNVRLGGRYEMPQGEDPHRWWMNFDTLFPAAEGEGMQPNFTQPGESWTNLYAVKPLQTNTWLAFAYKTKWRYYAANFPQGRRRIDRIGLIWRAYPTGQPGGEVSAAVVKIRGNWPYDTGKVVFQHTATSTAAGGQLVDTGWIDTDNWGDYATGFSVSLTTVPNTAGQYNVPVLKLEGVNYEMDTWFSDFVSTGPLGANTLSQFPVLVWFRNFTDAAHPEIFELNTRLAVGQKVTIDCAQMSVEGVPLGDFSYQLPNWLRLLPGSNVLHFSTQPGTADFTVTLRWRNRF